MPTDQVLAVSPTPLDELDRAVEVLRNHRAAWLAVSVQDRILILEESIQRFGIVQDDWVRRGLTAKGALENSSAAGWEWFGGPVPILRCLQGLRRALVDIGSRGVPRLPKPISTRPDGRVTARIYPASSYERLVTPGVSAEVWMENNQTPADVTATQASEYRRPRTSGSVVLVLGAGNISAIPVLDALYKLFVENQVVVLKMSPVNEYVGPLIQESFRPLVDGGFLRIVYGATAEGNHLAHHPGVDELHITGSDRTYEAITFGTGEEGARRKQQDDPIITKRFTGELGSIGPVIVVPGPWTAKELDHQAEELAGHIGDNASFSCSRTRLIITHEDWPLRPVLLDKLRRALAETPSRVAYYPGSHDIHAQFLAAHSNAEMWGSTDGDHLPWTLIANVPSTQADDICFTTESFCPIVAETAVDAESIGSFIDRAVAFANDRVWGTLAAGLIVHPASMNDPTIAEAVDRAIADLRYGNVAVNTLPGIAWGMVTPPWGSFPGNTPRDIQSGTGFIGNTYMLSRPEKVVIRAPFRARPASMWTHSRGRAFAGVGRKVADYERDPRWWRIPGIITAAMSRG